MRHMRKILNFICFIFLSLNLKETTATDDTKDCINYDRKTWKQIDTNKKLFVNCLGETLESGRADLIILLDRSGSMSYGSGTYDGKTMKGYEVAKQFIKALLSEVRISYAATRIAVVTFAKDTVTNINFIEKPSFENHKCKFNALFKTLPGARGATNIRGAMEDALGIFKATIDNPEENNHRNTSNKVVILLSDGEANVYNGHWYWDSPALVSPESAANQIKLGHRILYTVAVTSGSDQVNMEKWASHSSAFLYSESFNDMAKLAQNIRGDPFEKDFETERVSLSNCGSKCAENGEVDCGCNLKTGDFRCVCRRGYYGTGRKSEGCNRCKHDTYGERRGLIKPEDCTPCPANSVWKKHVVVGQSVADCECKIGHDGTPALHIPCTPKPCGSFPTVRFGTPVNEPVCQQGSYNDKCFYKCKTGYNMTTPNDYATCDATGRWINAPKCEEITCDADWVGEPESNRYTYLCTEKPSRNNDFKLSSGYDCTFTCGKKYYQKSGSKMITCLDSGKWDNDRAYCEASKCSTIPRSSRYISIDTSSGNKDCFTTQVNVGDRCSFKCHEGYKLSHSVTECLSSNLAIGRWKIDTNKEIPTCTDDEPPKFAKESECSNKIEIVKETLKGKSYAEINFEEIGVTDNSGVPPEITCLNGDNTICDYRMGVSANISITSGKRIMFKAEDKVGLSKLCRFEVVVKDEEKPQLVTCPTNIVKETLNDAEVIKWDPPTYTDNCGEDCIIDIIPTLYPGNSFKVGKKPVAYTAKDPSQNINEECTFFVHVKKKEAQGCPPLNVPKNGALMYFNEKKMAQMRCSSGHWPEKSFGFLYQCMMGAWLDFGTQLGPPLPDCLLRKPPSEMIKLLVATLNFNGDCNDKGVEKSIKANITKIMGMPVLEFHCGATTLVKRRKRSNSKSITMKLEVRAVADDQKLQSNAQTELNRVKQELEDKVVPNSINNLKQTQNWDILSKHLGPFTSVRGDGSAEQSCGVPGQVKANVARSLNEKCARCGIGTFQNVNTGKCETCPAGTYQPEEGKTICLSCPGGTVIVGNDIKEFTSCKSLCQPGEFSPNGLSPCFVCPTGKYSDAYRSTSCSKCPLGTTTMDTGAASKYECGSTCNIGSFSTNGVEPCQPCANGFYQAKRGQTRCLECPGLHSTASAGSTSASSCIDIQDCMSNPCLNRGNCVDLRDDYKCQCKRGYWGRNCEKEVDECALQPCLNNATCIDKFNDYECRCLPGSTGRHCDQVVKRCTSNTCAQHGKCIDLPEHKFKCVCDDSYTGEFCEATIDHCAAAPCQNEGFCQNVANEKKFKCTCKKGFEGLTCENKINYCSSSPCRNDAICINQNEGFACQCQKGYEGLVCETQTNICQHKKCHNGGECVPGIGESKCLCAPGFSGKQCDKVESSDFDFHFQSRVSPSFSSIHGRKDLHHFTLAFWMRTSDKENIGTPISYAVKKGGMVDDNALFLNDYSNFILAINNETETLNFDANDGEWHHVAVTWTSSSGIWVAYKDGVEVSRATEPLQKNKFVPKGGLFIIGEEQDAYGGDLTPGESFFGDLSQLNIWDRVFSTNEIYDLAMSCGHALGNVVAWSDFSSQVTGNVEKKSPSLACSFNNNLRGFQYLKDSTLPSNLLNAGNSMSYRKSTPLECAQACIQNKHWCRSFTFAPFKCNLYQGSNLIDEVDQADKDGTDLYSLSCIRNLGISTGRLPASKFKASSSISGYSPHLGRLNLVPGKGQSTTSWKPVSTDRNPYIEIDLGKNSIITGVATQGHFDDNKREFATSYKLAYYNGQSWVFTNVLQGNTVSAKTVRNDVHFTARHVRLYPKRDSRSLAIAVRFELYGCPNRPQGTPVVKSDSNNCQSRPCQNGGTCYDLYQRYVCVCPRGFEGNNCQSRSTCKACDLDLPINGYGQVHSSTRVNFVCKPGFKLQGSSAYATCTNSVWSSPSVQCVDIDECTTGVCSDGCENSIGSYRCLCPRGKVLSSNKRTCVDIDECSKGISGCQNGCVNKPGSYHCSCPKGHYSKGARVCYDEDECALAKDGCQQICENTKGGYKCLCRPGFTLSSNGKSCTPITCPRPPNINNIASISISNNVATYTCKSGYRVNGPIQRTCLPDSTWSGREPTCEAIRCKRLYKSEFGTISSVSTNFGAQVRFGCNSGYRMIGSGNRRCDVINNEAKWTGIQPYCVPTGCPFLSIVNGKILGMNTQKGSSIRTRCNEGFNLNNDAYLFRQCQNNGQWTGGNNARVECNKVRCGQPPNTGNVIIKLTGGDLYQNTASYSCPSGQCLNGNKIRHCQANGKWSGENPSCLSNSCCKPPAPKHATLYSNVHTVNGYAFVECDKGYNLAGSELRECQANLKWSGTDPQCNIVNCGDPGSLDNGVRRFSNDFVYLSKARFFCTPGYVLSGSRERVCQADGTWSGTQPSCFKGNGGHERGTSGRIRCNDGEICHWLIQVTQGQKIRLTFTTYDLSEESDRAEVYDGESNWEPFVTFTNILQPRQITSNGHFVRVITNGLVEIKYEETSCGGMFTEKTGVISSPNYPNGYPNNLNCIWTIHRPYNKIELIFTKFLLRRNHEDYVAVYEGPFKNTDVLLYNRFGYGTPILIEDFADRWLWINMVSNRIHNDKGFQAIWRPYEPRV